MNGVARFEYFFTLYACPDGVIALVYIIYALICVLEIVSGSNFLRFLICGNLHDLSFQRILENM